MTNILQLKDFVITRILVEWQASKKPVDYVDISKTDVFIDYDVLRDPETDKSLALQFRVKVAPPKKDETGYIVESEVVGFFTFPETMEEEQVQYLARVNGGTILYGILRGQVALLTGSFPGGKYMLPAIYMPDVVAMVEESKAKILKKTAARKKATTKRKGPDKAKNAVRKTDTKIRKR